MRTRWMRRCIVILAAVYATSLGAVTPPYPGLVAALLPIAINDRTVPGAYGSEWIARFGAANSMSTEAIFQMPLSMPEVSNSIRIESGQSALAVGWIPQFYNPTIVPGLMIFYDPRDEAGIHFSLRVQDLSRQSSTWGTEIPVVREHEFRTGRVQLPLVPLDARFRSMLRVYDVDRLGGSVAIRFYDDDGVLLAVSSLPLDVPNPTTQITGVWYPGYLQMGDFVAWHPQLAGHDRVRIEVEPPAGVHFWAFVSVTNNETQHVTLITPQ